MLSIFFMCLFAIYMAFFETLIHFGSVKQLSGSQFPDQGLNLGHGSESRGSHPVDQEQTPHGAFQRAASVQTTFPWIGWVLFSSLTF